MTSYLVFSGHLRYYFRLIFNFTFDNMCDTPDHLTLSATDNARLTRCKICNMYTLIYNNIYLAFSAGEFHSFCNTLENLSDYEYNKVHPNGEAHVLLKNSVSHMGISFSVEDVQKIKALIHEAKLYEEVFSILYRS